VIRVQNSSACRLDGVGGFHVLWLLTKASTLPLIGAGGVYRLFTKDYPEEVDRGVLAMFVGLLVALSLVYLLTIAPITRPGV
jgi:hypothetical protein